LRDIRERRRKVVNTVPRRGSGRCVSPQKRVVYELERVLRLDRDGLGSSQRRILIASLVTEFVGDETPERVRKAVNDAEKRDTRARAMRSARGYAAPFAAFWTSGESALIKAGLSKPVSTAEAWAAGHFSGVRAFFDVEGRIVVRF